MNIVYKDDTLYLDLYESNDIDNISNIKSRLFSIISQYEVDNVVINLKKYSPISKSEINSLVCDYHKKYKGNMIIDIK